MKRKILNADPDDRVLAETIRQQLNERISSSNALDLARTSLSRSELTRALAAAVPAKPGSKAAQNPKLHLESTRRNVNRYFAPAGKEQRKPSQATKEAIARILREDPAANRAALHRLAAESSSLEISIEGEVSISSDTRYRRLPAHGAVQMTGEQALAFLEAGLAGDSQAAYELFFEAYHSTPGTVGAPVIELRIENKR